MSTKINSTTKHQLIDAVRMAMARRRWPAAIKTYVLNLSEPSVVADLKGIGLRVMLTVDIQRGSEIRDTLDRLRRAVRYWTRSVERRGLHRTANLFARRHDGN